MVKSYLLDKYLPLEAGGLFHRFLYSVFNYTYLNSEYTNLAQQCQPQYIVVFVIIAHYSLPYFVLIPCIKITVQRLESSIPLVSPQGNIPLYPVQISKA